MGVAGLLARLEVFQRAGQTRFPYPEVMGVAELLVGLRAYPAAARLAVLRSRQILPFPSANPDRHDSAAGGHNGSSAEWHRRCQPA